MFRVGDGGIKLKIDRQPETSFDISTWCVERKSNETKAVEFVLRNIGSDQIGKAQVSCVGGGSLIPGLQK